MHIVRSVERKALALARAFPSLIVTGARQSGKTTLARTVFPTHQYVSLDLPSLAEQAENDPGRLFSDSPPPVVIDEVQYAPGLFRHVKRLIDERRDDKGLFILTGSQKFVLMRHVSDSLAGRAAVLDLENLSFADLRLAGLIHEDRRSLVAFLARGQFPELWKEPDIPTIDFYRGYLATYLERDVRQILNVANLRDFERFLRILAARSGTLLNRTEIAKDVGVSPKAIGDWLSVLAASGQISFLEPWFVNFGKRVVKTPKVYFNDTGLLCFLLGLGETDIERSAFLGQLWETFVFAELRKQNALRDRPATLWFYRDQRGREIDFLLDSGAVLDCLECKWSENPRTEDAATMRAVLSELGEAGISWKAGKAGIVCPATPSRRLSDNTRIMSVADLITEFP